MKSAPLLTACLSATLALASAGYAGAQSATPAGAAPRDPAALGRALYLQCSACHATSAEAPAKIGPHLSAIVGREAASVDGFAYSDALRGSGIIWDREQLDRFLARPAALVPGTSMAFGGLDKEDQRAALIAYLETLD